MGDVRKAVISGQSSWKSLMSWISISHAHEYWRLKRRESDPPSDLEQAETFILKGAPANSQDAACMLDVVCAYPGDVRCDGLDHAALQRVRGFLASEA